MHRARQGSSVRTRIRMSRMSTGAHETIFDKAAYVHIIREGPKWSHRVSFGDDIYTTLDAVHIHKPMLSMFSSRAV